VIEAADLDRASEAAGQQRDRCLQVVIDVRHAVAVACRTMLGNGSTLTAERARL
jgi:hypothetical protein